MPHTLYYAGSTLDRAGDRRSDPTWVAEQFARQDARALAMVDDLCLTRGGLPVTVTTGDLSRLVAPEDAVFLGLDRDAPRFAVDLSALPRELALTSIGADDAVDSRTLVSVVDPEEAGVLAYARGLLQWHRKQRFCGACGGATAPRQGGHVRQCRSCESLLFPRIEPAVITLVELPGPPRRCLLGRHRGAAPGRFTTLAGFVEVGESLEDAARREVAEEAGVEVDLVRYRGSQAWPFPAGLMVAFRARAVSERTEADGDEVVETRWFTADELTAARNDPASGLAPYRVDSIGRLLIEEWIAEGEERTRVSGAERPPRPGDSMGS